MLIDGIHVPLTAPFYRDGRSYLRKLEHNVGRYSLGPVAGLVALLEGSEGHALSEAEAAESLAAIAEFAAPEKVLAANVTCGSVRGALRLAEVAAEARFDVAVVAAPAGWPRMEPAELLTWFRAVADGSPLPVMLLSDGAAPGFQLPAELVGELAGHHNVLGMYDADLTAARFGSILERSAGVRREVVVTQTFGPVTGRMRSVAGTGAATFVSAETLGGGAALATAPPAVALKTRTKAVGFQVMAAGAAVGSVALLEAGVAGMLPRLAACAPQACHEVYAAFKDGDAGLAREKELRLAEADDVIRVLGVAGVKYGCDLNGYYGGAPRLPRLPLRAEDRVKVERVLRGLPN